MFDLGIESKKKEKGLSIEACIKKAEKLINKNGMCLFLLDVKGSKNYTPRQELQNRLEIIVQELNKEFDSYLPDNTLATITRKEKGFGSILGDAIWSGINDCNVIPKIANYLTQNYSDISFYLGVAKDGWDSEGLKLIK